MPEEGEKGCAMAENENLITLKVGDSASFTKTISESDVYLFGGITGDFSPDHFNAEAMSHTQFGQRIVHGILTFSLSGTASTLLQQKYQCPIPSVSYGYDHLRFTAPVFFGDTLTATDTISKVDQENMKTYGDIVVKNQRGQVVCVATHILKFFVPEG